MKGEIHPLVLSAFSWPNSSLTNSSWVKVARLTAMQGAPAAAVRLDSGGWNSELWFKSQADFETYSNSPLAKRLRDDGATFIGREIDLITEEQVIIS